MTDLRNRLTEAALTTWAAAAPQLGRDPAVARTQVLAARREARGGRVALLIHGEDGQDDLVLKQRLGGQCDTVGPACRAYAGAAAAFADQPELAVPRLIMALPDHQALILSHCPGQDARSLLSDSTDPADHLGVMQAAGRWLRALHRGRAEPPAAHHPAPALRRLSRNAPDAPPPRPDAFAAHLKQLEGLATQMQDRPLPQAVIHGDMTLGNLLIAPHQITGIDLENDDPAPVARDLAMLLVDHEVWFGFHPKAVTAFWQAYGSDLRDDPALRFFIALGLARLWHQMPADPRRHTPRRAHVWAGLQAMCARLAAEGAS